MLMKNITTIQKQVEGRNFDIRKHILEYDDVLNHHRHAIYSRRNRILEGLDIHGEIVTMLAHQIESVVGGIQSIQPYPDYSGDIAPQIVMDIQSLSEGIILDTDMLRSLPDWEAVRSYVMTQLQARIERVRDQVSEEDFSRFERGVALSVIDSLWMAHIDGMAHLREEVAFESYAQKNPLIVYKEKAYQKFHDLISTIEYRIVKMMLTAELKVEMPPAPVTIDPAMISQYQSLDTPPDTQNTPDTTVTTLRI